MKQNKQNFNKRYFPHEIQLAIQKASFYLPTPPLGQDMTQGQFLSGV